LKVNTLGNLCKLAGGAIQTGPFGSQLHQSDYREQGVAVVMPQDIVDDKISEARIARIDESLAQKLSRHLLVEGDIVFPRRGDISKRAYVSADQVGMFCGTGCLRIRVGNRELHPRWFFYFLAQEHVIKWIEGKAIGATMLNLNTSIIGSLPVEYPSYAEQAQIAQFLDAYDDLIAANQRHIQLLEESARLLYREWFIKLRFPNHEQTKIIDGIPEGWSKQPFDALAEIVMGQSPKSEFYNEDGQGLPFHQGVTQFGERFVTDTIFTTEYSRESEAGDILCSVRAPVGRLNITCNKIAIGRGLSAMRSRFGWQSLLFYQLKDYFVQEDMIGGGAIFASVSKKELFSQELLQPTDEVADSFDRFAKQFDEQIEALARQNVRLRQARDALLPKLMSGELRV
jgi:type I restriction enzyme S subunit